MLGLFLLLFLYDIHLKIFLGFICLMFPFWVAYAKGMSEYAKLNNTGDRETEENRIWNSVMDEVNEFIVEYNNKHIIKCLLEFGDVIHTLIKYITVCYLPMETMKKTYFWFLIFWFFQPNSFKHEKRYFMNGCIRNHSNINNRNHICNYGKVLGLIKVINHKEC